METLMEAVMEVEMEVEMEMEMEMEMKDVQHLLFEPDILQYFVMMYCQQCSPISIVSPINLFVHPIFGVPLLPHLVEPALVPLVHFSMHYAFAASISHLYCELLPQQHVNLYAAEVDSWQVVMEEEQHIDQPSQQMVEEQVVVEVEMVQEVEEQSKLIKQINQFSILKKKIL